MEEKVCPNEEEMVVDSQIESFILNPISKKRRFSGLIKNKEEICEEEPEGIRRSSRKKIRPLESTTEVVKNKTSESDITKYYLCKKVKRLPPTLETIFEEPKDVHNVKLFMSTRKFKRSLNFDENPNSVSVRCKLKKRKLKAKQICGKRAQKKINMQVLKKKLDEIET